MKKYIRLLILLAITLFINTKNVYAESTLDCSKLLKNGSKGEQVKILQKELNKVQNCNLSVDGSFGPATKSCVLAFQRKNKLTADALVGKNTCKKLNELYLNNNDNSNKNETTTLSLTTSTTLKRNSNNNQVKTLQEMLNRLTHCNLSVDGAFGYKTEWCVKKYQEENNLDIDGKVGPATRKSLNTKIKESNNSKYLIITKTSNNILNVRQDATTSSKDIGDVYTGTIYKIHGSKKNSDRTTWYKIEYQTNKYGYISGSYTHQDFIYLDISDQTIKLYRNGQVNLTVPTVTGNKSKGYDTPLGVYSIGTKLSIHNMGGRIHLSKYDAYVDYWMPFIGGSYGFHDADWRSSSQLTNKKTYLTNGSHGCVNMLTEDAKALYDNIYKGLKVFIVK